MSPHSGAPTSPRTGQRAQADGARSLKAIAILAALPLAALAFLGIQLAFTMTPQKGEQTGDGLGANHLTTRPTKAPVQTERPAEAADPIPAQRASSEKAAGILDGLWPSSKTNSSDNDPVGAYIAQISARPSHVSYKITPGDTLLGVFSKFNVATDDAQAALLALRAAKIEKNVRIKPNQEIALNLGEAVHKNTARPLLEASLRMDAEHTLKLKRDLDGSYKASIATEDLVAHRYLARGVISSSLSGAANGDGVPYTIISQFASIYSFDVDFQRDIHPNDTFEIYYTQYQNKSGDTATGKGEILFARLSFAGKVKSYYRYTSRDGKSTDYYDEHGKSARTFLMRTPVDGARISSAFGMRKHPMLGYTKMHKGVDFAAPSGTKIYAAGAGTIERASRFGTYGNFVKIRHANGYETAYAHLSRYGAGIKAGAHVTQGQVIGYVGTTGRSTGPHLHYEVLASGKPVNPMSVRVPTGIKLAGAELDRFEDQVTRTSQAMKDEPANQLASAGSANPASSRTR